MRAESVLLSILILCGCGGPGPQGQPASRTAQHPGQVSAQRPRQNKTANPTLKRITAELKRLNDWCRGQDDCDVSERPSAYPGRKAHGETNGFIASARERLRKLGATVTWDATQKQFQIAKTKEVTPPRAGAQPEVRTKGDVQRNSGKRVALHGTYRAIVMPSKRPSRAANIPKEYAFIELGDKTIVYLEKYNTPLARRPLGERRQFDGQPVQVRGTVHRVCPSAGQAPSGACLTAIQKISTARPRPRP